MAADGGIGAYIPASKQFILDLDDEIIVDGFAGGGGMSEAIYQAFGRHPYAALNHDDDALSCHAVNHPQTHHWLGDIRDVDPLAVTGGRRVGLLHLSPDCTHFSQAQGGQPRNKAIRGLAWMALRWAGKVAPRCLSAENVWSFTKWGKLIAKRDPKTGRALKAKRTPIYTKRGKLKEVKLTWVVAEKGERVPVQDQFLIPDPKHKGKTFQFFIKQLESFGYKVEYGKMMASHWGAGTARERFFLYARRDGRPIVWPDRTHFKHAKRGQKQEVGAYQSIDFSIPTKSVFGRSKELEDSSKIRLATGAARYVRDAAEPFLLPLTHREKPGSKPRVQSIRDAFPTITGANRGEFAVAQPSFSKNALLGAFMAQHNNNSDGSVNAGHSMREPISALTKTCSHQALATAHLVHFRNNCDARDIRDPLMTLSAGGEHHGVVECSLSNDDWAGARRVAAFLKKYHVDRRTKPDLKGPLPDVTDEEVIALTRVKLPDGDRLITDLAMRMIEPREAANAQGLPRSYIIEYGHDGRVFTRTKQFKLIGNSVSPPPAIALLRANLPEWVPNRSLKQAA